MITAFIINNLLTTQPNYRGIPLERVGGWIKLMCATSQKKKFEKEAGLLWQENIFYWSQLLT